MLPLPMLSIGVAAALCAAPAHAAVTTWQVGANVQTGFDSRLAGITPSADGPSGSLFIGVAPLLSLSTEAGRLSVLLRYQFLLTGYVLSPNGPTYAYQNTLGAVARLDLTSRLSWQLGVTGSQGRTTSFAQGQDPSQRQITAVNLTVQDFLAIDLQSTLRYEPLARLRITQPLSFRAFVPYGQVEQQSASGTSTTQSATLAFQSYVIDGGLAAEHLFPRAGLGAELRVGWFRPQGSLIQTGENGSLVTGQLVARLHGEPAPRWQAQVELGVFCATLASHFLRGSFTQTAADGTATEVNATLLAPVGAVELRYLFPRLEWSAALSYGHGGGAEVLLGRLTVSDAATLRLNVPLPRDFSLSGSAGYRYAYVLSGSGFAAGDGVAAGAADRYHLWQADAAVTVVVREGVQAFARYAYTRQAFTNAPATLTGVGQDYDGHLALLGISLSYVRK